MNQSLKHSQHYHQDTRQLAGYLHLPIPPQSEGNNNPSKELKSSCSLNKRFISSNHSNNINSQSSYHSEHNHFHHFENSWIQKTKIKIHLLLAFRLHKADKVRTNDQS